MKTENLKTTSSQVAPKKSALSEAARMYDKYKYMSFPQRMIQYSAVLVLRGLEKLYPLFSRYGNPTFYSPSMFDWTPEFEKNWAVIRAEMEEVLKYKASLPTFQDLSQDDAYLTNDANWKTFWIYNFGGLPVENNIKRCPQTAVLLEEVPELMSAMFSILEPGKHIEPHRGPFKGLIRLLFALKIPEPREHVKIRVGDDIRTWEEGEFLVFDDTFEHEVWNDTDGIRVVLFMDVPRPMRFPFNIINALLIKSIALSPKIKNMMAIQGKWDQTLKEAGFEP